MRVCKDHVVLHVKIYAFEKMDKLYNIRLLKDMYASGHFYKTKDNFDLYYTT